MSRRKVLITAGGTGGHVYPALSLAHQLQKRGDEILFVGGKLEANPFFDRNQFAFAEISCARPRLRSPTFPLGIAKGVWQSVKLFKSYRPDFLVGFGSYYTFPALIAAKLLKIPFVIHEQNSIPGRVNRLFTPSARFNAVHFPAVVGKIKGECRLVEMPLRPEFEQTGNVQQARSEYGFSEHLPVMLVFGGSQGAQAINQLLFNSAEWLKKFQILHFTGSPEWEKKLKSRYRMAQVQACVKVFEKDMAKAWSAADLVISRAGAVSIAEQLFAAVPGILIPYPHATDRHQEINADFLVDVGGALKLSQQQLKTELFLSAIDSILPKLDAMRSAMEAHKTKQKCLADCLEEL